MLVGMQQQDLGIDYLDRRNDFIEAVTLEEARRVARSLYDVDALSVVVVGQPEDLEADQDGVKEDG
jgi:zinc protease